MISGRSVGFRAPERGRCPIRSRARSHQRFGSAGGLQHPDAAIVNVDENHGGVQIVHGLASAGDVFDGWVDDFTIGKDINTSNGQANSTVTYDYQSP